MVVDTEISAADQLTPNLIHPAALSQTERVNLETCRASLWASEVQVDPWPHFEVDDVLPPDVYAKVMENWPETEAFDNLPSLVPGQEMHYIIVEDGRQPSTMSESKAAFWREFTDAWAYPLVLANLEKFVWQTALRFDGFLSRVSIQTFNLMHHGPDYAGQDPHNHYNHNVNWLFTFLIYVGDETDPGAGTGLHRIVDNDWYLKDLRALDYTVPFGSPMQGTALSRRSEFRGNKLISMIDSPVTLHSGTPPATPPTGLNRRIIRFHVGVPNEDIERVYGCSRQDFLKHFSEQSVEGRMREGILRDINISRLSTNPNKHRELTAETQLVLEARPPLAG
ncbi:MAG: hypothetical protein ABJ215_00610 [Alphaproteobacteria bacterium]